MLYYKWFIISIDWFTSQPSSEKFPFSVDNREAYSLSRYRKQEIGECSAPNGLTYAPFCQGSSSWKRKWKDCKSQRRWVATRRLYLLDTAEQSYTYEHYSCRHTQARQNPNMEGRGEHETPSLAQAVLIINSCCKGESRFYWRCGPWEVNPVPANNHMPKRERSAQIGLYGVYNKDEDTKLGGGMRVDQKGVESRSDIIKIHVWKSPIVKYFQIKIKLRKHW